MGKKKGRCVHEASPPPCAVRYILCTRDSRVLSIFVVMVLCGTYESVNRLEQQLLSMAPQAPVDRYR